MIQGKCLKQTFLLQNSRSSPSNFRGVELREWLQPLPNRDFILWRGGSSRLLQTNAKRCIDQIPLQNHTPGRPGCLAIINSWLNSPAGSTGSAVPAATDSASEKVHWRKSIHGKNESEGHSIGISLFTEKSRSSNQSKPNPNTEQQGEQQHCPPRGCGLTVRTCPMPGKGFKVANGCQVESARKSALVRAWKAAKFQTQLMGLAVKVQLVLHQCNWCVHFCSISPGRSGVKQICCYH